MKISAVSPKPRCYEKKKRPKKSLLIINPMVIFASIFLKIFSFFPNFLPESPSPTPTAIFTLVGADISLFSTDIGL